MADLRTKLHEILSYIVIDAYLTGREDRAQGLPDASDNPVPEHRDLALDAIEKVFIEVVGEDEQEVLEYPPDYTPEQHNLHIEFVTDRNQLRAELRQKIRGGE